MKLSATIITLNEEKNIDMALRSVSFADEVIVIDSGSTDRTVEIAKSHGATVIENPFAGFGQQKNFGADHANGEWILSIDADEEVTKELKSSILKAINSYQAGMTTVYKIGRKTNYCGKWIMHGGWYPDVLARLYKKDDARFTEPEVHEELVSKSNSAQGMLSGDLNHYSFPTVESQVRVNIKYARLGALALLKKRNLKKPILLAVFFRPLGKFVECYLIKRGFLDGMPGFIIAINAMYSMFMKYSFAHFDSQILIEEINKRDNE